MEDAILPKFHVHVNSTPELLLSLIKSSGLLAHGAESVHVFPAPEKNFKIINENGNNSGGFGDSNSSSVIEFSPPALDMLHDLLRSRSLEFSRPWVVSQSVF